MTAIDPREIREMLDRYGQGRLTPYVAWVRIPGGFIPALSAGPGGYTPMGIEDLPTHVYIRGRPPCLRRREILPVWANLGDREGWIYPCSDIDSSWGLIEQN